MYANGPDVRKDLHVSMIASLYFLSFSFSQESHSFEDAIKPYMLPSLSPMSVAAVKKPLVDWML